MLLHVPHEKCLFGFMISSDLDGDHVLNEEEWMEAFKHVNGEYINLLTFDHYTNEFDVCIDGSPLNDFGVGMKTPYLQTINREF